VTDRKAKRKEIDPRQSVWTTTEAGSQPRQLPEVASVVLCLSSHIKRTAEKELVDNGREINSLSHLISKSRDSSTKNYKYTLIEHSA
jgi:hypothetical protein